MHRLIPIDGDGDGGGAIDSAIHCYTGHLNERYSISSSVYSNKFGSFIMSGSEDGKVKLLSDFVGRFVSDIW